MTMTPSLTSEGAVDVVQQLDPMRFPLHGSRLIEASAGTGKTFTIALLYLRLVLQHGGANAFTRPLVPPEILVVTFTDAATQELRDRIRQRLAEAADVFGESVADADAVLLRLRDDYAPAQWPACARVLREAANWMDEAAVSTIHSWCYRMLREHAFDSGSLFHQALSTDQTELLTQVVQDYWRQQFYGLPATSLKALLAVFKSPEALQQAVQPMLARQDAQWLYEGRAVPPAHAVDLAALLGAAAAQAARVQAAEDAARALWHTHRAALEQTLTDLVPVMNGNTYRQKDEPGIFAGWLAEMAAWSEGGDAPAKLKAFSQSGIKLIKGHPVPQRAAFEAIDTMLACAQGDGGAGDADTTEASDVALPALLLRHAVVHVHAALEREKQRRAELGFDDLLHRLDRALAAEGGEALAQRIRAQFPVAMIDEFQDTDPLQYRIFERIYRIAQNDPQLGLFMIGDPKQAIYAFRGADIYTYLQARRATQGRHYSLGTNFRSTVAVVDAVNHCFAQAEQHPRGAFRFQQGEANPVPFVPVAAHGRSDQLWLQGEEASALTLWTLMPADLASDDDADAATPQRATVPETLYRAVMAEAAATAITQWLTAAQQGRAGFGVAGDQIEKVLRPADIAILVRSRTEAELVRKALGARGLASVYLSDRDSVFQTAEAADMLRWLRACAADGNDSLLRAALATTSMDWSWQELDRLNHDEQHWEQLALRTKALHALWQSKGVLPMLRQWLTDFDLPARWLATQGGERRLTNVLHLAEWLQRASVDVDGEQALLRHFAENIDAPEGEEEILRLESDADLIKVVTIHKSKGLEYPLVLLPFISSYRDFDGTSKGFANYHDPASLQLVVELARKQANAINAANDERLSEDMRLLYVAMTRARHALWLGVAPIAKGSSKTGSLHRSALGYLLGGGAALPDAGLPDTLRSFAGACSAIAVEPAPTINSARYQPPAPAALYPARAPLRSFDEHWWIASFSALTEKLGSFAANQPLNAIHFDSAPLDSRALEPETAQQDQFWEQMDAPAGAATVVAAAPGSMHAFPKGPEAGNFLHSVLEWCAQEGFAQVLQRPAQLDGLIAHRCMVRGWGDWAVPLQGFVRQWLQAPLALGNHVPDGQADGTPVALVGLATYQVEMEFWLSIYQASSTKLDALVCQYIAPGRPRPALLANQLNGMLKGFMDLVLAHEDRYYVADYKSNWLGTDAEAYTADAMLQSVLQHRYDVQYVLYTYALHRLLQQRLPNYDYERDVGGVLYWFLRGVDAPSQGMYTDKPPIALMDALDALFAPSASLASERL